MKATSDDAMIYTVAANDGKTSAIVCYYTNERNTEKKTISIDFKNLSDEKIYYILVDANHTFTEIFPENNEIELLPNNFVFITQDDMSEYPAANVVKESVAVNKNIYENI